MVSCIFSDHSLPNQIMALSVVDNETAYVKVEMSWKIWYMMPVAIMSLSQESCSHSVAKREGRVCSPPTHPCPVWTLPSESWCGHVAFHMTWGKDLRANEWFTTLPFLCLHRWWQFLRRWSGYHLGPESLIRPCWSMVDMTRVSESEK